MAVMLAGSGDMLSSQKTSRFIGPVLRWFDPEITEATVRAIQFGIRKTAHVVEYAVLSLLLWRARRGSGSDSAPVRFREAALFAIVVAAAFAVVDEVHQSFVPSRQGSAWDVALDTFGAALAMVGLWQLGRIRNKW